MSSPGDLKNGNGTRVVRLVGSSRGGYGSGAYDYYQVPWTYGYSYYETNISGYKVCSGSVELSTYYDPSGDGIGFGSGTVGALRNGCRRADK